MKWKLKERTAIRSIFVGLISICFQYGTSNKMYKYVCIWLATFESEQFKCQTSECAENANESSESIHHICMYNCIFGWYVLNEEPCSDLIRFNLHLSCWNWKSIAYSIDGQRQFGPHILIAFKWNSSHEMDTRKPFWFFTKPNTIRQQQRQQSVRIKKLFSAMRKLNHCAIRCRWQQRYKWCSSSSCHFESKQIVAFFSGLFRSGCIPFFFVAVVLFDHFVKANKRCMTHEGFIQRPTMGTIENGQMPLWRSHALAATVKAAANSKGKGKLNGHGNGTSSCRAVIFNSENR